MTPKSIVGDVINYRGMVYGPVNEMGVVALFALACEELGFVIEEIKAGYPDCHARKQVDRGWERLAIEFEYLSSNFISQRHSKVTASKERVRIVDPIESRMIELSQGGLKNGYINLKPIDDFWPEECCGGNTELATKHLIVELEGIGRVSTDISGRHKSLRTAHSQLKEFFHHHQLRAGDCIEILRVSRYEYRIRPASS